MCIPGTGSCIWNITRGTYTSQAYNKKNQPPYGAETGAGRNGWPSTAYAPGGSPILQRNCMRAGNVCCCTSSMTLSRALRSMKYTKIPESITGWQRSALTVPGRPDAGRTDGTEGNIVYGVFSVKQLRRGGTGAGRDGRLWFVSG